MRTTLDLPPGLIEEARQVGFRSKTDTVVFALREVVRRQRSDELKTLMGTEARRELATTLRALLDADEVALALPVRLELSAGTAKADRRAFRRAFSALPVLVPTEDTWRPLDDWITKAADSGERFAATDLLIARLADDIGALVWSLDKDVVRIERLKLVQTFSSPVKHRRHTLLYSQF